MGGGGGGGGVSGGYPYQTNSATSAAEVREAYKKVNRRDCHTHLGIGICKRRVGLGSRMGAAGLKLVGLELKGQQAC